MFLGADFSGRGGSLVLAMRRIHAPHWSVDEWLDFGQQAACSIFGQAIFIPATVHPNIFFELYA